MRDSIARYCLFIMPLGLAACLGSVAVPEGIDAVEEDWELVLAEPDVVGCGPQVTTTMSPSGSTRDESMSFNLNYRDDPFQAGGLQLRAWDAESVIAESVTGTALLQQTGETITWTQRMAIENGHVVYEVKNGVSSTWGAFGTTGQLRVNTTSPHASLDAYSVGESTANSGPGWQSNRVASMKLLRVRYYRQGQLDHVDETPKVVIAPAE